MRDEPQRAIRLCDITRHVRQKLREMSLRVPDGNSPIIPIIIGTEEAALAASRALADAGIYVPAVRPPTVAPGASRLRITLCCEHTDQEIERLLESLQVTMRS
jgi:8-amino-7-oxononanoate synthase